MERPGEPQRTASFRRRAVGEEKGDHGLVSFEIVAFGACSGSLPEVVADKVERRRRDRRVGVFVAQVRIRALRKQELDHFQIRHANSVPRVPHGRRTHAPYR
jgi:hypothetical protein